MSEMYEVWTETRYYVYSDWYERWPDKVKIWECDDYDPMNLLKKGCMHLVTALYPISAWKEVGGFDEDLSAWEDWDFQLKLADKGICGIRIPQPLLTYRKETGTRREENYDQFEKSKQGIVDRWGKYFENEEELMACNSCAKKKVAKPLTQSEVESKTAQAQSASEDGNDLILIEYIGGKIGSMNYKGTSGQVYRFGANPGETQKLVKPQDAEHFAAQKDFRIVQKEAPVGATS